MSIETKLEPLIKDSILRLLNYCKTNEWAGYDPFDGLNSRLFKAFSIFQNKFTRLVFIQGVKRSPVNLRPLLMIRKEQNPKGIALFIQAVLLLYKYNIIDSEDIIVALLNRLIELKSEDQIHYCWGYNFDWQNRYSLLKSYHPNIICTAFAGNALLDAYEIYNEIKYLKIAQSASRFIIEDLNISTEGENNCFSYTPYDKAKVHNANMLGANYLARIFSLTGDEEILDHAIRAMRYSVNNQNDDGSWYYGEGEKQRWIDNFHTGYNLLALNKFKTYTINDQFLDNIKIGYEFYLDNFITQHGIAKYYHNKNYPIDIHSIALSLITLSELQCYNKCSIKLADDIFKWSIKHMQHKNGYFYYQKGRFLTNRISYMRWSQAWMLYALAIYLENRIYLKNQANNEK